MFSIPTNVPFSSASILWKWDFVPFCYTFEGFLDDSAALLKHLTASALISMC